MSYKAIITDFANKQKQSWNSYFQDERECQIERLKKQINILNNKITLKDSNLLYMKFQNEKLTQNLINRQNQNECLKAQLTIINQNYQQKQELTQTLFRQVQTLKVTLSEKDIQLEMIQAKTQAMEVSILFKDNDIQSMQKQIDKLKESLNQTNKWKDEFEKKVKQAEGLPNKIIELVKQVQTRETQIKSLKKELHCYKQKYDDQYFEVLDLTNN